MLNSLRGKSLKEREQVLAAITQHLLPRPHVEPSQLTQLEEKALYEIARKLKIDLNDSSPQTQTKLFRFIAEEIVKPIRESARWEDAKYRLGQMGELRGDLYQIIFHRSFFTFEQLGIRRAHVEEAIRNPHSVEHLLPDKFTVKDSPAISLSVRHLRDFSILVQTFRSGYTQQVIIAWRLYHSEIPSLKIDASPLDMLKAFVDHFGVMISVPGLPATKFILYEVIPFVSSPKQLTQLTHIHSHDQTLVVSTSVSKLELGVTEIGIFYAIDRPKYVNCLKKHHVQIVDMQQPGGIHEIYADFD